MPCPATLFAIRPRPPGIAVPIVIVGLGLFFASLLSVFFLLFLEYGAHILGEVLATSNGLPFFGGSWIGFLCGCAAKRIDEALHERMSHLVERALSFR